MLLVSAVSWADTPSYSYIEASYVNVELDDSIANVDGDGFIAAGSVPINDDWHAFVGYSSSSFDFGIDLDQFAIGGGWHRAVSATTDFVAEAAYVRADANVPGFSADDSGIGVSVGVRGMLRPDLEVFGSIDHVELDEANGGTAIGGGVWYTVSGNLAVGLNVSFDDDATGIGVGIRLYFDR